MRKAPDAPATRLRAAQEEQTPQALARLAVIGLFICLWFVLALIHLPMPRPFLIVLAAEATFFVFYWRFVFLLPNVRAVSLARYGMLAAEVCFHTTIVYFLGGIAWLGAFAYVFGLIFTNAFLDLRRGLVYAAGASAAFTSLIIMEATSVIPHYTYLDQGSLRYADTTFVATTIVASVGVFISISMWVNWVGRQVRQERDAALGAQEALLRARAELQKANEALEARVRTRTAELEATNAALKASEERLRTVVTNAPIVLLAFDRDGVFTLLEGEGLAGMDVDRDAVIGRSAFDIFEGAPDVAAGLRSALGGTTTTIVVSAGGRSFETLLSPVRDYGGRVSGVIGVATNITERAQAEEALRQSERKFRAMAETLNAMALIVQGTKVVYVNPAAERLTGYTEEELLGMEFWETVHPDYREVVKDRALARQQGEDVPSSYELKILMKSGESRWVNLNAGLLDLDGKPAVIATAFDVTAHKQAEEALRETANRDPLTGLLNRRAGLAALQERFGTARQDGNRSVVFVLDLDRFKSLNDTYSHEIGDAALLTFAGVLVDQIGDRGVVCRLGGDEFEIGIADIDEDEALAVADGIQEALRDVLEASSLPGFTVSIGIASAPDDGETLFELGGLADRAMYSAKAIGGGCTRSWRQIESGKAA